MSLHPCGCLAYHLAKEQPMKIVLITAAALLATLTGCATVQEVLTSVDKPTAQFRAVDIDQLAADAVTLAVQIDVINPYSFDLPLTGADYTISAYGQQFIAGGLDTPTRIPARDRATVTFRPKVPYDRVLSVLTQVRPGSMLPYDLSVDVQTDRAAVNAFIPTIRTDGELPIPAVPNVRVADIAIDQLDLRSVDATVKLNVTNTNAFRVGLDRLGYQLQLGGVEVADASLNRALDLPEGDAGTVEIPLRFSPMQMGMAMFNLLQNDQAGYRITGDMQMTTPFGNLTMPYQNTGTTPLSR
jgi:LEA14-like dessication related protein